MKYVLMIAVVSVLGLLASQTFPARAHEQFTVGQYRIEVGWASEPIVTWQLNAVTVIVTNASSVCPGSCQGIPNLSKNLTITLFGAGQSKVFRGSAGQILTTEVEGVYNAPVIPTQAGGYNATVVGIIGNTAVNLLATPDQFERVEDGYQGGDNGPMFPTAYPSPASLQSSINDTNNRVMLMGYAGIGVGIVGIGLAALALIRRGPTRKQ